MLLLGGPLHGHEKELTDSDSDEIVIMAPSPGNPVPTPWKYQRREIEAETRPGIIFRRSVLVAQGMPIELATQGLAQILLQRFAEELVRQFMEGGELIVNDSKSTVQSSGSGIILAK